MMNSLTYSLDVSKEYFLKPLKQPETSVLVSIWRFPEIGLPGSSSHFSPDFRGTFHEKNHIHLGERLCRETGVCTTKLSAKGREPPERGHSANRFDR